MPRGNQMPVEQESKIYRPKDVIQLIDKKAITDTTEFVSSDVECGAFRHFGLHVFIDSTGAPTTLQVKVQFLDRWSGRWYTYKQGPFAALFWEDGDTASGIAECFSGPCMGRAMRLTLTGVGTTSIAYFTASIAVEFWN